MSHDLYSEDDIEFIEFILEKYSTENSIFNVSEMDGFLTAIVSGPDMIMPSEWLPAIWGSEKAAPEWESEEEFSRFISFVMGIMNENAGLLVERPEDFDAMFLLDEDKEDPVEIVAFWCIGYMRAVALRPNSWLNLPKDIQQHLHHIAMFGSDDKDATLLHLDAKAIEKLQKKIVPAARAIHAYWLAQRAHAALGKSATAETRPSAHIFPFVRTQPKISANAPCPCGSGKKYKKCCGGH